MIRQALMRFMYGRNGIDQLGTFMLVLYLITWVIQLISHWFFLILLEYLLLILVLFRMLSAEPKTLNFFRRFALFGIFGSPGAIE